MACKTNNEKTKKIHRQRLKLQKKQLKNKDKKNDCKNKKRKMLPHKKRQQDKV
jgi:hypothetical protein